MKNAGKQSDIKIYPGAGHAFMNPNNKGGYVKAAAKDAWARIDAFFARTLGGTKGFTVAGSIGTGTLKGLASWQACRVVYDGRYDPTGPNADAYYREAMSDLEAGRPVRGTDPRTYSHVRAVDLVIPPAPDWRVALKDELVAKF